MKYYLEFELKYMYLTINKSLGHKFTVQNLLASKKCVHSYVLMGHSKKLYYGLLLNFRVMEYYL